LQVVLPATLWFISSGTSSGGKRKIKGVGGWFAAKLWFIRGKDMV
jgi:hypothetical protein